MLFCGLLVSLACSSPDLAPVEKDEIVLGAIAPVASSFFTVGPDTIRGAELAVAELNAVGGIEVGGERRLLRLVIEDSEDRPEVAVSKAFRLIEGEGVVALLGLPISDHAVAVGRVAEELRVPMISTGATHPEVTLQRRFAFRTIFDDAFQAGLLAEFAYRDLGVRKAALFDDPGRSYTRGLAEGFEKSFEALGGEVVVREVYTSDDPDASRQLEAVSLSAAEVLVLPLYSGQIPIIMPQVRNAGIELPVLGGDSWSAMGEKERRGWAPAYYPDVWAPDALGSGGITFLDGYRERYRRPPTAFAALSYDAVALLAAAIEQADSIDPRAIRQQLYAAEAFVGITGSIDYHETGDPIRSAVILYLDDQGQARLEKRVDP